MRLFRTIRSFFPTALPVGMDEFDKWANNIIDLSGRFADEDSMKFALSSMIVHLEPTKGFIPARFFVKCLRKAAANQVASQVFQDIKTRQQPQTAEVTPVSKDTVASDGKDA